MILKWSTPTCPQSAARIASSQLLWLLWAQYCPLVAKHAAYSREGSVIFSSRWVNGKIKFSKGELVKLKKSYEIMHTFKPDTAVMLGSLGFKAIFCWKKLHCQTVLVLFILLFFSLSLYILDIYFNLIQFWYVLGNWSSKSQVVIFLPTVSRGKEKVRRLRWGKCAGSALRSTVVSSELWNGSIPSACLDTGGNLTSVTVGPDRHVCNRLQFPPE